MKIQPDKNKNTVSVFLFLWQSGRAENFAGGKPAYCVRLFSAVRTLYPASNPFGK